jgi:hypothetical protein
MDERWPTKKLCRWIRVGDCEEQSIRGGGGGYTYSYSRDG